MCISPGHAIVLYLVYSLFVLLTTLSFPQVIRNADALVEEGGVNVVIVIAIVVLWNIWALATIGLLVICYVCPQRVVAAWTDGKFPRVISVGELRED